MQHTPYALARLAGALALALAAGSAFAQASPAGTWKTIDDNTGKQKGEVTIVDNGGTFTGKVSKILVPGDENKTCTKCTDDRKDQPIKGLTILTGLKPNGNNNWDGGQILDPENGKVYSAKMSLSEDGQKLNVRGFLGISLLGRTQTWVREQ
ncbi:MULTISPECIES: DUF2147 domain-containing protein [Ralstonia]|jgi:uncharacterized protein (DUF2147 family)|uniref:DUF2147 domain-containing protein n=1 Tax=Ralstonia pickettii OR214 TaxID=1264675 RepID=R0E2T0_RALPI|nr:MULTISPECIES: DUF2147 domain-containing protein [Ralstonia]MBE3033191.1 DUF2147 domain-containing protein [Actinomycetota bacterium]MEA3270683.1 DUF2147 domain-containing protein [Pseudomonadota bacterium]ENZ76449.1 hypothetical protein OR214_03615 [Ralstonia pickettii OR214]MCM3578942.1 DUF2147 domain-containing protein [Ralstonia pickettii]MDR9384601.1 DUF2147 domain-containing protein [Ralstonia sp. 11b]